MSAGRDNRPRIEIRGFIILPGKGEMIKEQRKKLRNNRKSLFRTLQEFLSLNENREDDRNETEKQRWRKKQDQCSYYGDRSNFVRDRVCDDVYGIQRTADAGIY